MVRPQRWLILSAFFHEGNSRWIDDFYTGDDIKFEKLFPRKQSGSWHARGPTTPAREWVELMRYAFEAVRSKPDGIITNFPPLSLATAVWLTALNSRTKLIAWTFNTSAHETPWKGLAAAPLLRRVDRFVVHSRYECEEYARWLHLPREKFAFVPLQRGQVDRENKSPIKEPYVLAMGSAHRDYETLVQAVRGTGIKTVIVAAPALGAKLTRCPEVTVMSGLTEAQCLDLLSGARVNVTPMDTEKDVAGQVTFLTALRMGVPTVASRCAGNADYLEDGKNALVVPVRDVAAMRNAIQRLWNDQALHAALTEAGLKAGETVYSDEAAGVSLGRVVLSVQPGGADSAGERSAGRASAAR